MFEQFTLIAGPCVLEDDGLNLRIGEALAGLSADLNLPIVFKASYDKANRSKADSARGPGLQEGLRRLARVKRETGLPVITDIHEPSHAERQRKWWMYSRSPPSFVGRRTFWWQRGRQGRW